MARQNRITVPEFPHHITHRGNRKADIFLDDIDRHVYLKKLITWCVKEAVKIWAWCLMTNHVHLIAVPARGDSLSRLIRRVHGDYVNYFNAKYSKTGHLWEGRFDASLMDERHLWNGVRYVERNPVRAGMVKRAEDYRWSSAAAHCGLRSDRILSNDLPLIGEIPDWSAWLAEKESEKDLSLIRSRTRTGRLCADDNFIRDMEKTLGRQLLPKKVGRKKKTPLVSWEIGE
jgi:putative transposase